MSFVVLIPARMASTRLPNKPLADLGGLPMVVRVARQALASGAARVVVATDDARVQAACDAHQVQAVLTHTDHASGSDRLAQACDLLALPDTQVVVNLQGDEPLMPPPLLAQVAALLTQYPSTPMATAAHPIHQVHDFTNPNVVKVVLDATGHAITFTRAPIPWWRDGHSHGVTELPPMGALRHIGLYAYRAGFLRRFIHLPPAPLEQCESLEQLRVLWHGHRIAVRVSDAAPPTGVDTPADLARVQALLAAAP
jgi:3-deoxy-manno-octulosonate cytidylyltransferase (CMP-KDO synthetase)